MVEKSKIVVGYSDDRFTLAVWEEHDFFLEKGEIGVDCLECSTLQVVIG